MRTEQERLYRRILAFSFDRGDEQLTFVRRLARDNRWPLPFAERVLLEYRRFLFLAVEAGHLVTPSEQVDQAWHLHLTYTRSYWKRLCGETLGVPLHHEPTAGGPVEQAKYAAAYEQTLQRYAEFFGESPPKDIWPPVEIRFAGSEGLAPPLFATLAGGVTLVCVAPLGLVLAAWQLELGMVIMALAIAVVFGIRFALWRGRSRSSSRARRSGDGGCSAGGAWFFFGGGSESDADSGDGGDGGCGAGCGSGCGSGCGGS